MTATRLPTADEIRARQESSFTWHGYLADDNVQHVADRIRNLLSGRRFAFASINASHTVFTGPEVRTSQQLRPDDTRGRSTPSVYRIGDEQEFSEGSSTSCGISVSDSYGAWSVYSGFATQAEARAAREAGKKNWTHIVIEGGRTPEDVSRKGIQIQQFNGPGEILHWTITPEEPPVTLADAVYDLERLERIAKTPRDRVSDRDWSWYAQHSLADGWLGSFSDAVPAVLGWLRGGAR